MKKRISLILASLLLLTLAACQTVKPVAPVTTAAPPAETHPQPAPLLPMTPGLSYSQHPVLEVQAEALWQENGQTKLSVLWKNSTAHQAIFGSDYLIERLEKGAWVSCAIPDEIFFDALAHVWEPNSSRQEVYVLTGLFDLSIPGTYRFRVEAWLHDGERDDSYALWSEFTLGDPSGEQPMELPFRARYIRTDGYHEGLRYPGVAVIDSRQALLDYHRTYLEMYSLGSVLPQGSGPSADLLSLCEGYDDGFFAENYLVFLILQESSGSIRHQVTQVLRQAGRPAIYVHREVPEVGTADMAQWHVILELERPDPVPTSEMFQVYLDGRLAYGGGIVVEPLPQPFYKQPPAGLLSASTGEIKLSVAGCAWYAGDSVSITDEAGRPLPRKLLENSGLTLQLDPKTAETVMVYLPEKDVYEPTNCLGYFVKLHWERMPDSFSVTCWPDTVWEDDSTPEEAVVTHENAAFYARPGRYVYEITATWEDDGTGCHGTARYYVCLCDQ